MRRDMNAIIRLEMINIEEKKDKDKGYTNTREERKGINFVDHPHLFFLLTFVPFRTTGPYKKVSRRDACKQMKRISFFCSKNESFLQKTYNITRKDYGN
jgi:hypothetical protein